MQGGNNSDIAVAILAAAIIGARPDIDPADAVARARAALGAGASRRMTEKEIAATVRDDAIQCLEDGTWHTMLRRYIARKYNMTPDAYREKWGLDADYPFVAPAYARRRANIARKNGLGQKKAKGA